MANKKQLSSLEQNRVNQFMEMFSRESSNIRSEIATSLLAYNKLLSMHARTFEEFALLPIAKEKGLNYQDPLFDYSCVKPSCCLCGEPKRIRKVSKNKYFCNNCGKKFAANKDSITSNSKSPSLLWMKVLQCMLDFYSVKKTCAYCNITPTTYYKIRNRIFYAMQLMMDEVKLYGEIQCDNTFVKISYKGMDLNEDEYPEDSVFDTIKFVPRSARKRGGGYNQNELNMNQICIFTCIDDRGHVMARFANVGAATAAALYRNAGSDKYLYSVPDKEPFMYQVTKSTPPITEPGSQTMLIADGEFAIRNYANKIGIPLEANVYRRDGKQVKLPENAKNIQRVNNLHKKLKDFLRKTNYISSKYLPGYLVFFEFIENTGATEEAISYLFQILAKPGLGRPAVFFKELYTIPNYLIEWHLNDSPLIKHSYNQLRAGYLYSKKLSDKENNLAITLEYIKSETGYSASSVRRIYKNFCAAGLIDTIIKHFEQNEASFSKRSSQSKKITPEILAIYDEFAVFYSKPKEERVSAEKFLAILNEKYKTNLKRNLLAYYINRIESSGLRSPTITTLKKENKLNNNKAKNKSKYKPSDETILESLRLLEMFDEIRVEHYSKNIKITNKKIYSIIAERENVCAGTIAYKIDLARKYKLAKAEELSKDNSSNN